MLTEEFIEALATVHLHPQTQAGGALDLGPLLRAVEAAAVAAERERCAVLVEAQDTNGDPVGGWFELLARKIRGLGA